MTRHEIGMQQVLRGGFCFLGDSPQLLRALPDCFRPEFSVLELEVGLGIQAHKEYLHWAQTLELIIFHLRLEVPKNASHSCEAFRRRDCCIILWIHVSIAKERGSVYSFMRVWARESSRS